MGITVGIAVSFSGHFDRLVLFTKRLCRYVSFFNPSTPFRNISKQVVQSSIWNGDIQFSIIQNNVVLRDEDKKKIQDIDQVLIAYGDHLEDLTAWASKSIHCPKPSSKIRGLRLYNLHEERGAKYDAKENLTHKPLRVWYVLSCANGVESDHGDLSINLAFRRNAKTNAAEFLLDRSTARQESCADQTQVCK